jgi:hypothetical protein
VADKPIILGNAMVLAKPAGRYWFYDEMFNTCLVKVKVDKEFVYEERLTPHYSVQEVAKFFFGRTADWLRWRYLSDEKTDKKTGEITPAKHPDGYFVLDGVPLEPKKSLTGYRWYTIADVERMAHALAQNGAIDGWQLDNIVNLVKAAASVQTLKKTTVEETDD